VLNIVPNRRLNSMWMKTWRDLWQSKGRSALVVLSIALSTFTLGVILNSYAILSREMTRDYLRSNPTAISFYMERFDKSLLDDLKMTEWVDEVDARRLISGEIKTTTGDWKRLLLFVLNDFNDIKLDKVKSDRGSWPPQKGQILIERQAVSVLDAEIGTLLQLKNSSGLAAQLTMAGIVHDVGLPQAEWENIVYGYISQETLNSMGIEHYFNELKVSLNEPEVTLDEMTNQAVNTKLWLQNKGYSVKRYKVAPLGEHPHANITDGMFMIQKVFALLCCFLSAILVFNLMSAMLSKQLRQIGVMKAIGASNRQISGIYYRGVLLLGLLGLLISLPTAYLVGNRYVDVLSPMMNFDITSYQIPLWIIALQILLGIGIPMLSAYLPIKKASQIKVRETLLEYNADKQVDEQGRFERFIFSLNFKSHPVRLAIRNSLRQKSRFILTTGVLMIAASLLMASFNIARTMKEVINIERYAKNWAVEIKLNQAMADDELEDIFNNVADISQTESFNRINAAIIENDPDEIEDNEVTSTERGNSKSHKISVSMTDLKPNSTMLSLPLIEGSWFHADKSAADQQSTGFPHYSATSSVVVSQLVMDHLPYLKLGMSLDIEMSGQIKTLTLIGVVKNIGSASIYTSGLLMNNLRQVNGLFLSSEIQSRAGLKQLKKRVIQHADKYNIKLSYTSTAWDGAQVVEGHFQIIFSLMLLLTVIIIFIASNGIILTMTTNIIERTRENGVLKAIGASNRELFKMILSEAVMIAFLGWLVACIVTLPLSYGVAYWLGELLIKTPFGLTLEPYIFILSLPAMILITCLASLVPMARIMRLPVREALVYE